MKWILILSFFYSAGLAEYYYSNGEKIYITPSNSRSVRSYEDENGRQIRMNKNILVKLKDNVDLVKLQRDFEIKLLKQYSKNLYLVQTKNEVLKTANRLYEDDRTIFAHPDLIRKVIKR